MFDWLRGLIPERKALDTTSAWGLLLSGYATASTISVNAETAWRCPIIRGAIAIISESIAQLPLLVYERTDDGAKARATSHPLFELLHDQPNDFTSSYELRRDLATDTLLFGHAFAHLGRSRASGAIVELIRIPPPAVTLEENDAGEPLYYVTDRQGTRRQIDRADILHITATGRRSPIDDCREAIGVALAAEAHTAKLFASGARPAGLLKMKGGLPAGVATRLGEDFNQKWAGSASSGRTMLLEDGSDFVPLQFTSTDAQLLELRRLQVAEIARAFRIPPHMLADLERTTHHNAEEMGQQFLEGCLLAHLVNWEGAMRRSLLTPEERRHLSIEFLVDGFARAALAPRYVAFSKATAGAAWMSANEARARENLPPIAGGDVLLQPLNMTPSDEEPVAV